MTIVMEQFVPKLRFIAQVSEYLQIVEKQKISLVITHREKPIVKVIPV